MEGIGKAPNRAAGHGSTQDDNLPGMPSPGPSCKRVQPVRMSNECQGIRPQQLLCYQGAWTEKMGKRKVQYDPPFKFSIDKWDKKEIYCFQCKKFHKPQILFYLNQN